MNRRTALAVLAAAALPFHAQADPVRLSAGEIDALLRGKRIEGDWNGTAYEQSFSEAGHTLYQPDGGPADRGRWRVNADTDSYESWWERTGWSSYPVERDGAALYWVDGAGKRHPFRVTGDD